MDITCCCDGPFGAVKLLERPSWLTYVLRIMSAASPSCSDTAALLVGLLEVSSMAMQASART